jgi:O-antigen/teichoic acid export membrane protein
MPCARCAFPSAVSGMVSARLLFDRAREQLMLRRRYLLYMPILLGASALLFLRTFLYARIFQVEDFGLLNQALLVATTFTSFAGFGMQLLGHKLLPQYHAREDRESFDDLVSSCLVFCAASASLAAVVLVIATALGWLQNSVVFVAAVGYGIAQYLFLQRLIEVKSELRFLDHSKLSGIRALALLITGVVIATTTHSVAATLAAESLVTLAVAIPLIVGERGRILIRKSLAIQSEHRWLSQHYPAALRLLWLNGTSTVLYAVDRWFGIALLTKREYGIFALGLIVITLFETLQVIVNVSAYPLMGRMIAGGDRLRAFKFASLATTTVIAAGVIFYVPFVFLLDFLLHKYLPSYVEASTVIKLAVVVGMLRLADFYASFSVLLDRERRLALAGGALLAVAVAVISAARASGVVDFSPNRMMQISLAIAACAFAINLTIATNAARVGTVR